MKAKVVLGLLFGDEGKGVTVQNLVREAQSKGESVAVVRFSGGPQAAHAVISDDKKHICSTYGAGVLLGVETYLTGDVYFDPYCANQERLALEKIGISCPVLRVSNRVREITPWDVFSDRDNSAVRSHGTCGKGIHASFVRHNCSEFSDRKPIEYSKVRDWYERRGYVSETADKVVFEYAEARSQLFRYGTSYFWDSDLSEHLKHYDTVIFEGSQGLLLDMDRGFFPHVTPSHTGIEDLAERIDLTDAEIYLVCRPYLTRHGNGWDPLGKAPELFCKSQIDSRIEINAENEYQGRFKTGAFDIPLAQSAWDRHCIDNWISKNKAYINLVITHADAFSRNCGPDKAIQMIAEKRHILGNSDAPDIDVKYVMDAAGFFDRLPFKNKVCKLYMNSSPEGNMTEVSPDHRFSRF